MSDRVVPVAGLVAGTVDEVLAARNAARDAQDGISELLAVGVSMGGSAVYDVLLGLYAAGLEAGRVAGKKVTALPSLLQAVIGYYLR